MRTVTKSKKWNWVHSRMLPVHAGVRWLLVGNKVMGRIRVMVLKITSIKFSILMEVINESRGGCWANIACFPHQKHASPPSLDINYEPST